MHIRIGKAAAGLLMAAACVVAVAGCGNITTPDTGSSVSNSTAASTGGVVDTGAQYASHYTANGTATITAGQPLTITLGTMDFKPNTLTVAKGTAVTLKLVNSSALNHNFSLDPFHVSQNADAGQTVSVSFTPDQSGTFYFYCNVSGHAQAGMVGKITVQ